jgi:hypothetical protein
MSIRSAGRVTPPFRNFDPPKEPSATVEGDKIKVVTKVGNNIKIETKSLFDFKPEEYLKQELVAGVDYGTEDFFHFDTTDYNPLPIKLVNFKTFNLK